jgi:hypothetical protein
VFCLSANRSHIFSPHDISSRILATAVGNHGLLAASLFPPPKASRSATEHAVIIPGTLWWHVHDGTRPQPKKSSRLRVQHA